ncbi:hypothetical protein PAHAL_6G017900 [Panicum hallii]|uniref:Uncharacterized protein n=1 Tax=Panicum hallii TaxID=206008 RepID=A0A2T8IES7_9POAL|nr:hypothetical protein PAHAL_6G017900 [Panicum hallii]
MTWVDGISFTVHPGRGAAGLHGGAFARFDAAVAVASPTETPPCRCASQSSFFFPSSWITISAARRHHRRTGRALPFRRRHAGTRPSSLPAPAAFR